MPAGSGQPGGKRNCTELIPNMSARAWKGEMSMRAGPVERGRTGCSSLPRPRSLLVWARSLECRRLDIQAGWLGLFAAALVAVLVAGGVALWRVTKFT